MSIHEYSFHIHICLVNPRNPSKCKNPLLFRSPRSLAACSLGEGFILHLFLGGNGLRCAAETLRRQGENLDGSARNGIEMARNILLVGGWPTPLKNMKVSWDFPPTEWQVIKFMFPTTSQLLCVWVLGLWGCMVASNFWTCQSLSGASVAAGTVDQFAMEHVPRGILIYNNGFVRVKGWEWGEDGA